MPRFDVIARGNNPLGGDLTPIPTAQANQTQQPLDPALVNGQTGLTGPIEGRPPGAIWAHQGFGDHAPQISVEMSQAQAQTNTVYNPAVASNLNSGIDPTSPIPLKFHPGFPTQNPNSVWTFNGTIPPKLVMGRYGEPLLFRHHNRLPADVTRTALKTLPPARSCSQFLVDGVLKSIHTHGKGVQASLAQFHDGARQ